MANINSNEIIGSVSPHTIKKFELIEAYVVAWAHKLLEYGRRSGNCNGIVLSIACATAAYIGTNKREKLLKGHPYGWLVSLLLSCGNKTIRHSRRSCISMIFRKPRSLS